MQDGAQRLRCKFKCLQRLSWLHRPRAIRQRTLLGQRRRRVPSQYAVTAFPGGAQQSISGSPPTPALTFYGLTNLQSYTFTVTTTSAGGTSVASVASNAVTPISWIGGATGVDGPKQMVTHSSARFELSRIGAVLCNCHSYVSTTVYGLQCNGYVNGSSTNISLTLMSGMSGFIGSGSLVIDSSGDVQLFSAVYPDLPHWRPRGLRDPLSLSRAGIFRVVLSISQGRMRRVTGTASGISCGRSGAVRRRWET